MAVFCDRIFSVLLFSLSSAFWSSIVHIHISVVRIIRYEAHTKFSFGWCFWFFSQVEHFCCCCCCPENRIGECATNC